MGTVGECGLCFVLQGVYANESTKFLVLLHEIYVRGRYLLPGALVPRSSAGQHQPPQHTNNTQMECRHLGKRTRVAPHRQPKCCPVHKRFTEWTLVPSSNPDEPLLKSRQCNNTPPLFRTRVHTRPYMFIAERRSDRPESNFLTRKIVRDQ